MTTTKPHPKQGVTFVTALYLPSSAMYKKVSTYINLFHELARTGVPIMLYIDDQLRAEGTELVRQFPNIVHCEFGSLDRSWIREDTHLPAIRNQDKDTAEYFCIQLAKLNVLAAAAKHSATSHLAWIDFGIYHVFRDKHVCHYWLNKIAHSAFPSDRIFVPGCWSTGQYNLWDAICWRYCGGFLLGAAGLFEAAAQRQNDLIREHMPRLTWEVNYWTLMEEHFLYYAADHNESLLTQVCDYTCP